VLRAIMDISARAISLAERPRAGHLGHQCSHAPGRPNLRLVSSSRRPRQVTQFAFGTKTVAVNYITNSDRRLLAQTPRPQSPVGQNVPSQCRAVQKARSCFFVCAFFYWNRLRGYSFCVYERARHHPSIRMGLIQRAVGYAHTQRHCRIRPPFCWLS
jgi:hypothetical protein